MQLINSLNILSEQGILDVNQGNQLLDSLEKGSISGYQDVINFLYPILFEKTFQREFTPGWHTCYFPKDNLSAKEIKIRGKAARNLLDALLKINLIGKAAYDEVIGKIRRKEIIYELEAFIGATTLQEFNENFTREKQLALLDKQLLYWLNTLGQSNTEKLKEAINGEKLHHYLDFFSFSDNAIVFESAKLPATPGKYLRKLCRELEKLTPGFIYDNLKQQLQHEDYNEAEGLKKLELQISFTVNAKKYKETVALNKVTPNGEPAFLFLSGGLENLFNKVLADHASDDRLILVQELSPYDRNHINPDRFAFLKISKREFTPFSQWRDAMFLHFSTVSYQNSFSHFKIAHALDIYNQAELLKSVAAKKNRQCEKKIYQKSVYYYSDILEEFPDSVYTIPQKLINTRQPYKRILKKLSAISAGIFNPVNINDGFKVKFSPKQDEPFKLSFISNGKKYMVKLQSNHNQLDYAFLQLVKRAVNDLKAGAKYYDLVSKDNGERFIFLNKKQYKLLENRSVLEFLHSGRI